jgi:hypothetical protein
MGNLKQYCFRCSNRGGGNGSSNRLEAIIHHCSRLFAYMIGKTLEEMKGKLKENNIIVTSGEVKNMEYPVVQVEDIDIDTQDY